MIIPKSVKVGNFTYNVQIKEEPIILDYQVCSGMCDCHNQVIQIDANLTQQNKERVFLHELFHSMLFNLDIDLGEETERVVDGLAKSLHGVLVDNRLLFMDEEIVEGLLDEIDWKNECDDCCGCDEEEDVEIECADCGFCDCSKE